MSYTKKKYIYDENKNETITSNRLNVQSMILWLLVPEYLNHHPTKFTRVPPTGKFIYMEGKNKNFCHDIVIENMII